ncbi:hypothetical protein QAO71_17115 (plasmid) [Halopseudomonas sp. SMJS2]|uniref:hypothetical protein n=1 Tax=Halopseudomonas sp. SMJS2 TaxID=3041098 RepID=UPI0024531050|nr:hypothetical protein [Halopseudomonas sp. SMJS2]WGK63490.1 hypothetical protein QAO71_17115 [Halopseudomonas sp. SMJS2]
MMSCAAGAWTLSSGGGKGGGGNAYAVGYTMPDEPNHLFPPGSRAYARWAAGVDNAREDR